MKKTIASIIILVIVAALLYSYAMEIKQGPGLFQTGTKTENVGGTGSDISDSGDREVQGVVVSVNTDQVPVDGPMLVTITTGDSSEEVIAVPSMGINFCAAQANIADVYELNEGDTVQVRGQVGVDDMIIPCESAKHYLRVIVQ